MEHVAELSGRHVSQRLPAKWYKTIDKVAPKLLSAPKLLLEDMKARPEPVLDLGAAYPHHNLYYLTSTVWDLRVLGGLVLSEVVEAQIAAYTVKMRGGTLRFQSQYLRRLRVPAPDAIPLAVQAQLRRAFDDRDVSLATVAALEAYGLKKLP